MPHHPSDQDKDKSQALEAISWLDRKGWTDEDKVCVVAALFPLLMVRLSDDKGKLDRTYVYFAALMEAGYEAAWKLKSAQKPGRDT